MAVTGGFHIDGFMDTMDAFHSYKPREEKLAILKDSHIGAFAVIMLAADVYKRQGQVQVRKSTDYVPKMISLAGGKYIFDASNDDDTGRSTMNMQLEDFYNGAIDADYLIYNSCLLYTSRCV